MKKQPGTHITSIIFDPDTWAMIDGLNYGGKREAVNNALRSYIGKLDTDVAKRLAEIPEAERAETVNAALRLYLAPAYGRKPKDGHTD